MIPFCEKAIRSTSALIIKNVELYREINTLGDSFGLQHGMNQRPRQSITQTEDQNIQSYKAQAVWKDLTIVAEMECSC